MKSLADKPWSIATLLAWSIALFEYLLQVPANRIGYTSLSLSQLEKILQEVITLVVFLPFSVMFVKQKSALDFFWSGLRLCGEVYFIFRN
jgi:hypothetical protein